MLTSYPYVDKTMCEVMRLHEGRSRWLIDSGAFQAFASGKPIKLDDYCRFLESLPIKPWQYFALDVIGDPAATRRNYETMLARGLRPVPIVTKGEDFAVLDEYFATSDVVALGGLMLGGLADRVCLQPISLSKTATAMCVQACIRHNWRLSVQVHKLIHVE